MKQFKVDRKIKHDIITLTEKELNKIWTLDLSDNPRLDKIRDLFCFATFTGQRWSDIILLKKEDVKEIKKGRNKQTKWIFESKKTKELREVPFVGFIAPALDILRKYDYSLPVISLQNYNNYLKDLGDEADINETVKVIRYSGSQRLENKNPKYLFMSSHMARRSCVTILLQRGIPPTTVMKLTGHKDLKTLMKYENTSQDAQVDALEKT
jgi:integrase